MQSCLFNCDICILALQNTPYLISINGLIVKVYHQTKLVKNHSEGKGIAIVVRDKLQEFAKMEIILLILSKYIFHDQNDGAFPVRHFENTGKSLLAKVGMA